MKKRKRISKAERALRALIADMNDGLVWRKNTGKFYAWLGALK